MSVKFVRSLLWDNILQRHLRIQIRKRFVPAKSRRIVRLGPITRKGDLRGKLASI